MFRTVLSFDMRAPDFGAPTAELYSAALDMCAFGDGIGIDGVIFPEHHASEDGYNPAPALMATAAAARTRRMEVILGALVLPLHDPVEIAETIAVTDIICDGRLTTTLAAGYVEAEFSMFGKSLGDRARLMDEGLSVITRALAGERFLWGEREICSPPRSCLGSATREPRDAQDRRGGAGGSRHPRTARSLLPGGGPAGLRSHADLLPPGRRRRLRRTRAMWKTSSLWPRWGSRPTKRPPTSSATSW
jgi:alkanesulfonate monooxygenase SsuD/methylene tetrahydromethanopterin reductase-like flavin-dependent oxidoreductase (luciferase family)